jgi:hypothetical protein
MTEKMVYTDASTGQTVERDLTEDELAELEALRAESANLPI